MLLNNHRQNGSFSQTTIKFIENGYKKVFFCVGKNRFVLKTPKVPQESENNRNKVSSSYSKSCNLHSVQEWNFEYEILNELMNLLGIKKKEQLNLMGWLDDIIG